MNFKDILLKLGLKKEKLKEEFESNQESLNPTIIGEEDPSFESVKDIACRLQKNDARNIALTGPYGSGKSSVLLTLKEKYSKYNYLDISLATLKPDEVREKPYLGNGVGTDTKNGGTSKNPNSDKNEDANKKSITSENLNRLIEYSILQQLIYREKQSIIPNSRFKRIIYIEKWKVRSISVFVLLEIIALGILFKPKWCHIDWLYNLLSISWLNTVAYLISIVFLLLFSYWITCKVIRDFSNCKLNKLNLKDGEIELKENTSIFNKHMDEILYFFQMTQYDVVIIEDLDRFETTDIFLKLRELNNIINSSKVIKRKKIGKKKQSIVFIYAVRDDMFKDSDRSKFFDYISTIIPIVNPSNSNAKLKDELKERGITDINDDGISDIAFFIDDMRLLKNIANEYVQYREKLVTSLKWGNSLSPVKLLAMMTYKNYFPRDFAELHYGRGTVYKCLRLKDALIEKNIEEIDKQIEDAKLENKRIYEKIQVSEKELRTIYVYAILRHLTTSNEPVFSIDINESYENIQDIIDNENLFNELIKKERIHYKYVSYSTIDSNFSDIKFKSIEKEIDPNNSYQERLAVARNKISSQKNDIQKIELKKDEIRSKTFCELAQNINLLELDDYKALKVPSMIEYFLKKGYINEDYYDYISYFHEGLITKQDWEFVLNLKLNRPQDPRYHIEKLQNCIKKIPESVYKTKAILNIDILDFLISNKNIEDERTYSRKYNRFIKTIRDSKSYDFIAIYYMWGKARPDFFKDLFAKYKDTLWKPFVDVDKNFLDTFMVIWFIYGESEYGIEKSESWIENNYQFITENISRLTIDHISKLIETKKYLFKELNNTVPDLIDIIIKNGAYLINSNNITVLVNHLLRTTDINEESVNLSTIHDTGCDELIKSAHDNLKDYITEIFKEPFSKKETERALVYILGTDKLSDDEKKMYLSGQERTISQTLLAEEKDKTLAIQLFLITPSWSEVYDYMVLKGNKVTEELSSYISHYKKELVQSKMVEKDKEQELLTKLTGTNVLAFDTYQKILDKFNQCEFTNTDLSELEPQRVALLISKDMIKYTAENTKMLQSSFDEDIQSKYILQHKEDFVKDYTAILYSAKLATILLSSDKLDDFEKAEIVKLLKTSDLEGSQELADTVLSLLTKIEIDLDLDFDLNIAILANATNVKHKIALICYNVEKNANLNENDIQRMLKTLPGQYVPLIDMENDSLITDEYGIESLLKVLRNVDYISSYEKTKDGFRVKQE